MRGGEGSDTYQEPPSDGSGVSINVVSDKSEQRGNR